MKKFLTITLCVLGIALVAQSAINGRVRLTWSYPTTTDTSLVFKIYTSTSMSIPLTNWTVVATVPYNARSYDLTVTPGEQFFVMTASNFWGQGDFSNVAGTPPAPSIGGSLAVQKLP
jgi:hypothetical protein